MLHRVNLLLTACLCVELLVSCAKNDGDSINSPGGLQVGVERLVDEPAGRVMAIKPDTVVGELSDALSDALSDGLSDALPDVLPDAQPDGSSDKLPEPAAQRSAGADMVDIDIAALQSALASDDYHERLEAVVALGESGLVAAIGPLSIALLDQTDVARNRYVREEALDALVIIGGEPAADALSLALNDGDTALREASVYALAECGLNGSAELRERVGSYIELAAADPSAVVRSAAAQVLDELAGP